MSASLLLAAVAGTWPAPVGGAVLEVPQAHPGIQQAVDAAAPGDVIRVAPGTYQEHVRIQDDKAGITIEAADPQAVPVLLGTANKSADGIRVDGVPGVVLRNLRIVGSYDGVRLNRVVGALVSGLVIEDTALAIRVNRGADNVVTSNTVLGTRVEQGILVDGSPRAVIADNVVDAADEEGIRVASSAGATVHRNRVSNSQGNNGITVSRSPGASIVESLSVGSYRDGFRVMNCPDLALIGNLAVANGNVGFRIEKSPPFATVADVLGQGNLASGNQAGDVVVEAARCNRSSCETTTTLPTLTTTTRPTTTTSTTQLPPPTGASWRFYVRIASTAGGPTSVLVPSRSGDVPVSATIREDHIAAFRIGDRVSGQELMALGGKTLARLAAAADAHIRAHPADYPTFTGFVELRWAERAAAP